MNTEIKVAEVKSASDIIVVLDKSQSMGVMGQEPIQALNDYIKKQQEVDPTSLFSLYTFNQETTREYFNIPLGEMKEYTDYTPNGLTACYDCIFQAIKDKMETDRNRNVVMLVITDGMDNSSKRFSQRQTSLKIKDQESTYNWQVVFLASNLDVYGVGNSMGMDRCKTSAFAQDCKGDFTSKMASISACTSIYRESSKTTEPRKLDITVTKPQ